MDFSGIDKLKMANESLRAELARKDKVAERIAELCFCGGALTGMTKRVYPVAEAAKCTGHMPVALSGPMSAFVTEALAFAESEIPPAVPMLPADAEGEGRR